MPARAAGLRPSASHAAAATLPWPWAASPAASAIANPAVNATQLVVEAALPLPCANAGTAITDAISNTNINIPNFRIVVLLINCRQEVVDAALSESNALTLNSRCQTTGVRHQVSGLRKILSGICR